MAVTALVSVTIRSNPELSDRIREGLPDLNAVVQDCCDGITMADVPDGGLASLDPDTVKFLLDISQTAGTAAAGVLAKEMVLWLWNRIATAFKGEDPKEITLTIGKERIEIPKATSPEEVEATVRLVEAAIRARTLAQAPGPDAT